ncbi:ATPase family associated with various cellular activities (AAA) domain-containing protein [Hirsutella rhossiliensis]|uniref:ATPase family associated with various cellular activities (AAA) domain-containing protein n=1 Tax=Hirsutella rhossiliensis TaxID=111463 RepID=A0A9P8SDY6_9HYPO|nr:ATPase family associated with various cellular activities (AAA) domain-containing protein [Hirsutella rhossiliensis]KAH0957830.1 ATPase family associated with various cellular activities (AAA) domain-containing protein [Hirsutella rhossiliensis]
MNGTVNATPPWVWDTQPPYRPLTLPNFSPGISGVTAAQLLAFCLNSYTPLVCLFELFSFPRTYVSYLLLWLEEHFTSTVHIKGSDEAYDMHLLSYQTELKDAGFYKEEEISITYVGRSFRNKTTIFENRGDSWKKIATKKIRPLSTIIVSEKQKQQLVANVKSFLDPETRNCFSLSVAGELDVDIYIVGMPSVNDRTLKDLFADLPQKCVVLLEDIDAVGMERSPDSADSDESQKSKTGVTMSGLLNTLDGVASQEGRVLIMTTNHIEKLDEALIRPGRVDKKVEFQYADAAMTSQLFGFIFQQDAGEDGSSNDSAACDLAADFATKVPELEFSPAEILSHLLQYRKSPTAAVEHAEEWVATMRREKFKAQAIDI